MNRERCRFGKALLAPARQLTLTFRGVRSRRATERRTVAHALTQHGSLLRAGFYLQRRSTIRHWRQPLPEHVVASKAGLGEGRVRLLHSVVTASDWRRPLRNKTGREDGATILISDRRRNSDTILLNTKKGEVRRISQFVTFDESYERDRSRLQTFIVGPSFSISADRHTLIERLADGAPFRDNSQQTRAGIVRALLCATRQVTERFADSPVAAESAPIDLRDRYAEVELPAAMRPHLDWDVLQMLTAAVPIAPSHGDLGPGNILVNGGVPIVIDWGPLSVKDRPFWADSIHLLMRTQGLGYWDGVFDVELDALWRAAEMPLPRPTRAALAVAWVMLRPPHLWLRPSTASFRPLATYVEELWPQIKSGISGE